MTCAFRPAAAALLAFALVLCAAHARAQEVRAPHVATSEASAQLGEGRRRYVDLDFGGAIEALRRALAVPGIAASLRLEAYEYLGASYLVLDQLDDARAAFLAMLTIDPYHVLREPSGSPKIAGFVARLRAEIAPDAALDPEVHVTAEIPRAGRVGRAMRVHVRSNGGARVTAVRLRVRGQSDETWETIVGTRDGAAFVVTVPPRTTPDMLELYVEARDSHDRLVARAGEPSAPLSVEIHAASGPPATASTPFYERWWFWTAVGVVAVGVGVGVGVAATSGGDAPPGTLAPGRVELP